jgi:hydroxyacylglutathione hydrolase
MFFRQIFEPKLAQYSYLIGCQRTAEAIVIDPMRDIRPYFDLAQKERLRITTAADTHIHADYVSGLREMAERGVAVFASDEGAPDWRYEWLLNSRYEHTLLKHNDTFSVGNILFRTIHTPGHTPEHIVFAVTDSGAGAGEPMGLLTGDFIFVGDVGRPDLLETAAGVKGDMDMSARRLYRSIVEFMKFPDYYQVWPAHGAGSACGKTLGAVPYSTVGYERRFNPSIKSAESEEAFVAYVLDGQPEPPMYFSRMKRVNKIGPPILRTLPEPKPMTPDDLVPLANNTGVALIDTRRRDEFMRGHIPDSILSPWNRQFNTVAACYVEEGMPIYLIIEEENLREAVRDLVNVGLDNIVAYATFETLEEYKRKGGALDWIEHAMIQDVGPRMMENPSSVLDVRRASEYAEAGIPGAMNISHTRLLLRFNEIRHGEKLHVYCRTGSRSAVAAAFLKRKGYDVVYVDGEFEPWIRKQGLVTAP